MTKILVNYLISVLLFNTTELNGTKLGEKLFQNNCSLCHLNGTNIIIPEKNLKEETLIANGMKNKNSLSYLILNGKNGMPAFGGRLTENEIEAISNYLLNAIQKMEN